MPQVLANVLVMDGFTRSLGDCRAQGFGFLFDAAEKPCALVNSFESLVQQQLDCYTASNIVFELFVQLSFPSQTARSHELESI